MALSLLEQFQLVRGLWIQAMVFIAFGYGPYKKARVLLRHAQSAQSKYPNVILLAKRIWNHYRENGDLDGYHVLS